MKPNELRIGNHVVYMVDSTIKQGVISVISKHKCTLITENNGNISVKVRTNIIGIPLTNEWLVKLGFKWSDKYCLWFIKEPFYFPLRSDFSLFIFRDGIKIKPDYVHELQNLYIDLTGQELTIKE